MDLKKIQELIQFVSSSGVSEVDLETKDFKIIIRSGATSGEPASQPPVVVQASVPPPAVAAAPPPAPAAAPAPAPAPSAAPAEAEAPAEAADSAEYITIKSPMIGTFYRSPSPDKPAFLNIGDVVEPGSVICIIEAMKLFNEIESEVSGKIVKVLVDDAAPVEYDTPLFLVDPS